MTKELSAALFDFSDTSDLSEAVASKLTKDVNTRTNTNAEQYGALVSAAGVPVSISAVIGAAERFFGAENVPTAHTVRKYLVRAVELGYASKPSKNTYGAVGLAAVSEDEDTVDGAEAEAPVESDDDILNGLED